MATIITGRTRARYLRQPKGDLVVDESHPHAQDLRAAFVPVGMEYRIVYAYRNALKDTGRNLIREGTPKLYRTATRFGQMLGGFEDGQTDHFRTEIVPTTLKFGNQQHAVMFWGRIDDASEARRLFVTSEGVPERAQNNGVYGQFNNQNIAILFGDGSGTGSTSYRARIHAEVWPLHVPFMLSANIPNNNTFPTLFINGRIPTNTTTAGSGSSVSYDANCIYQIGGMRSATSTWRHTVGGCGQFRIYIGHPAEDIHAESYEQPWAMYRPRVSPVTYFIEGVAPPQPDNPSKVGGQDVVKKYVGNTEVVAEYVGGTKIWPNP